MTVGSDAEELTAGHQDSGPIDLSRRIGLPVTSVWQALISPQGAAVWLGEGAVLGGKGESYHCTDGTMGVVRSYHPLEQLRVTWHADEYAPFSLIEVDLEPVGDATGIYLRHDGVTDARQREMLQQRWAQRLEALEEFASRTG